MICLGAAAGVIPITSGGAVVNAGASAAILLALGVGKDIAINFSLASGLLLVIAATVAALGGVLAIRRDEDPPQDDLRGLRAAVAKTLAVDVGGPERQGPPRGRARRRRVQVRPRADAEEHGQAAARWLVEGWDFDRVSIGVPAPVADGRVLKEPVNLGEGLEGLRLRGRVREADEGRQRRGDAGDRQLRGRPHALPRARHRARLDDDHRGHDPADGARHLPYRRATFEEFVGRGGRQRLGPKRWRQAVFET